MNFSPFGGGLNRSAVNTIITNRAVAIPNVATRMVFGEQVAFTDNAITTFHDEIELQQHFDAVRVLYGVGPSTNLSVTAANLLTVSDLTDTPASFNGPTTLQVAASSTFTITAPSSSKRQTLQWTDWAFINSIARADAGTKPLLVIRTTIGAAASLALNGSTASLDAWATSNTDNRYYRRRKSVTATTASSQSNWHTNGIITSLSPVVAIQYLARGRIITLAVNDDSTGEGVTGTRIGAGYVTPLANSLASASGIPVEVCNMSWTGTTMAEIAKRAVDFAPYVQPAMVYQQIGSWNGVAGSFGGAPTNLTAPDTNLSRRGLAEASAAWAAQKTLVVARSWLPINGAASNSKQPQASDSLRRAYNASGPSENFMFADVTTSVSGGLDGNGQETIAAGQTTDGLHCNDTGYATQAAALLPQAQRIFGL